MQSFDINKVYALSYTLWECANKTYIDADTADVFDTKAVVTMDEKQLREKLLKYKVALQPNKQPIIWRTLCETIENDFAGDSEMYGSGSNRCAYTYVVVE